MAEGAVGSVVGEIGDFVGSILCTGLSIACPPPEAAPAQDAPNEIPPGYYDIHKPLVKPKPPAKPPKLVVPENVAFQPRVQGIGSIKQRIAVQNSGGQALDIHGVDVSGTDQFGVEGGHTCKNLEPGGACLVTIFFDPKLAGKAKGTLLVSSTAGLGRVQLLGEVLKKAPPAPPPPEPKKKKPRPKPKRGPTPAELAARAAEMDYAQLLLQGPSFYPATLPAAPAPGRLAGQGLAARYQLSLPEHPGSGDAGEFPRDVSTPPVERCRILSAGRFIPLTINHSVNSQIGGPVKAFVPRDIYGADGRLVLLPRGTWFVGAYEPLEKQGDTRVGIKWTQVERPDGSVISVTKTVAADVQGQIGAVGEVDNRFVEKYGTVIATTALSAAVALATRPDTTNDGRTVDNTFTASGEAATQSIAQITADALRQSANLAPRVKIKKGTAMQAVIARAWYFPRPQQVVELDEGRTTLTYDCNDGAWRDVRGISQNTDGG